jgi:hypothetical protein
MTDAPRLPLRSRKEAALKGWKDWVAFNANELSWIALVTGAVAFAGLSTH